MRPTISAKRFTLVLLSLFSVCCALQAQEKSSRFAHIKLPGEGDAVAVTPRNAFVKGGAKLWRIDTDKGSVEQIVDVSDKGWFTQVQGVASKGENLYYYVNGEGIYSLPIDGNTPTLVRPRSDEFVRNYEEAYSSMNVDPTGRYLLLYGWNENVAVFDILNDMKPICAYNDYVKDAYWQDNKLWAAALDKVVINTRQGRSMDNQDFINYGSNDQHGMTKIYLKNDNILPNMGEVEVSLGDSGELIRLIHNKGNGDLLLCTSTFSVSEPVTTVYKLNGLSATPVAKFKAYTRDIAAHNNKIVAQTGRGFLETTYGAIEDGEVKGVPIVTDLIKPRLWSGAKEEPYKIENARFMEYDKDGNLWIIDGQDLFVMYK